MKKLGLVITDGVGYRNFVLSSFLEESTKKYDHVIILSCIPKEIYPELDKNITIIELSIFTEGFTTWFFKKWKEITHLRLFESENFGIRDNLNTNKPKGKSLRAFATRFIFLFSRFFASEKLIQSYNKFQQQTFKNQFITKEYISLLRKYNITTLFFTHQRPPYIAPLIYAAEKLKIKTVAFIFSWDNLASKGRMAGNFNHFLVWSQLMKEELLEFYKNVSPRNIHIVGTPQFEPYSINSFGYSKKKLIEKFNLRANQPIVLFTCNDSSSKNDPIYLDCLAEFIKNKKLVKEVNLVVRTSPAETPKRFEEISKKYPFIKWNYPKWVLTRNEHQESWSQRVPSVEDISDLKSLLNYSDFNINVLSTITLDAFLFNTPVINPVFGNSENKMFNDQKFLKYRHLQYLVDSSSTYIVKNKEQYLEKINLLLNGEDKKQDQRNKFLNLELVLPLKGTSKRIVNNLFYNITNTNN